MSSSRDCPCASGLPYARCCEPFHRGEKEAGDAETLMRSRFAAYAKKQSKYIFQTLHPEHEDRGRPEADVMREIREATSTLKFMRLAVLDRQGPDEGGLSQVLFYARVFEKGKNRSFIELSDFLHDGNGWRYVRGKQLAESAAPNAEKLSIAEFHALHEKHRPPMRKA